MSGKRPASQAIGVVLLAFGIWSGLRVPDLDLQLGFLVHRSMLTHGAILPLLAFAPTPRHGSFASRGFAIGFGLANAVHLCFDLFPRGWNGFALIHAPFYGRTSALFSQVWIALSIVICLYIALALIYNAFEAVATAAGLIAAFWMCAAQDGSLWPEVMALASGLAAASFAAYRAPHGDSRHGKSAKA